MTVMQFGVDVGKTFNNMFLEIKDDILASCLIVMKFINLGMSSPYFTKLLISEFKRVFCKKIRSLVFNTGV